MNVAVKCGASFSSFSTSQRRKPINPLYMHGALFYGENYYIIASYCKKSWVAYNPNISIEVESFSQQTVDV